MENVFKNLIRFGVAFIATSYIFLLTLSILISHYKSIEFWIWSLPFLSVQLLDIFYLLKNLVLKPKEIYITIGSVTVCLLCFFSFLISNMVISASSPTTNYFFKSMSTLISFFLSFLIIYSLLNLKNKLTVLPEAHSLVRTGPYKYLRHPLYFSYILFFISSILMFNSITILLVNSALIGLFIIRGKMEERVLERNIEEYKEYKESTPFIPGLKWL